MSRDRDEMKYQTSGALWITRSVTELEGGEVQELLIPQLDDQLGAVFTSSYEYPGRYTRWEFGFVNPPLRLSSRGMSFRMEALNSRGEVLLAAVRGMLSRLPAVTDLVYAPGVITGGLVPSEGIFAEEDRSKQNSVFTIIRAVKDYFYHPEDEVLGLYGAFSYDLVFQFEKVELQHDRPDNYEDLVLYLPDEIYVTDHQLQKTLRYEYEFQHDTGDTEGLPRTGRKSGPTSGREVTAPSDHEPGAYAELVRKAIREFAVGNMFEVVPGQTFYEPCSELPSVLFKRLSRRNPSPYGFLINLGQGEYLIGASPEMYVRVEGRRIETCPISGTIPRGRTAIEDAEQIKLLMNSEKDESELTMCTDVDRNDKSRICVPGSVRVIGRRQIELYSRLIHTVDHVEGQLREGYDALDAFLTHMWAVTVTGAPKRAAITFIEQNERSPRKWYGGAVGFYGFNGSLNTGLTLRTIRLEGGVAEVRAGATLLYDSDPEAEERETQLKASAMRDAILKPDTAVEEPQHATEESDRIRVLLVDHEDSFVHTLANYFRQAGAEVVTHRAGFPLSMMDTLKPDLVVLSPGPGRPADFQLQTTIDGCLSRQLPVFGVCLGLQGIVEYFGGELEVLDYPMHGKRSVIRQTAENRVFKGISPTFGVARYHSLYAAKEAVPECLQVTGVSEDGVVMAVEHKELPVYAVQFHPESILTLEEDRGLQMIRNVVELVAERKRTASAV
ncbi:anthranilate synthase component I [Paenibacillus tarimensis]|uniref:anthranilate synthase component I n=1 Tax=Paenibacillus tarimensis TaxID=416012 RepID=UPI001F00932D|nr:anthranilate synthase component I [Paenibacillus tarimensis]MCF2945268.1 anthranilate synthase component I [Paenibacillus tarimensis]